MTSEQLIESLVGSGLDAYAHALYFEAHERFEQAWLASGTPRSVELHALAHLASHPHRDEPDDRRLPGAARSSRAHRTGDARDAR